MKLIINNVSSQAVIGGRDFLIDPDLITRFREYLSVKVPGAFFAAKKLRYHWDGMKYFITPGGKFATGFLPPLLKFIDEVYPELNVEIIDQRGEMPQFKDVVKKIGEVTLYDHQRELIEVYNHYIDFRGQRIYFPRGVVDAGTNAGKTLLIAGVYLSLQGKQNMLVVIHRTQIYKGLLETFIEAFGEVGQICPGKYSIKPVTLCMINTLYSRIDDPNVKKDLAGFTVLAVDEAHRAGAATYTKCLVHCPAAIRVFVSGSALDSDNIVSKMIIVGQAGPKLGSITKRELMDKGVSTKVVVKIHLCNTILRAPVLNYDDCIKTLIHESTERVAIMAKIIGQRQAAGPILIFTEETEHGKFLYSYLKDRCMIELTHSQDPDLIQKVDAFRSGDLDVLISTGTLKEGVNLPQIRTIIDAAGGQSKIYLKQRMGRGERKFEGKEEFEYHDFYDIGRYVQKHSLHRIKIYQSEDLPIEMDFDLKNAKRLSPVVIN